MENSCRHCRFSEGDRIGLWCWLHARQAIKACAKFEREPGSDDDLDALVPEEAGQA